MIQSQPQGEAFQTLIARIKAGDRLAFDEFFARYDPKVRSVIRNRLRNFHQRLRSLYETGDFSNDIWSTLWQRMPALHVKDETDFLWQLNRIAEDKIIDASRRQNTRKRDIAREQPIFSGDDKSAAIELQSHEPTPSKYAMASELDEALSTESANLGEDTRMVFRLKRENYSNLEIAEATGFNIRKIQRLIHSIRMRFINENQEPSRQGR